MIIKLLVDAGDMKPGPAIGQKLGPLGINIGRVIQEVNKASAGFKGMKVPVEIDIDTKTKNFGVSVSSPPVAELLKRELRLEKASGEPNRIKIGNLSIEQIISVAKTKSSFMLSKDLKSAVKSVIGSCVSLGIMVENKEAKEIEREIDEGRYDEEIRLEKITTDETKRKELDQFFASVKARQEEMLKREEEKKKEEEEKKAAVAPTPGDKEKAAATGGKQEKEEEIKREGEKKEDKKKEAKK